jgi:hypothetical protein
MILFRSSVNYTYTYVGYMIFGDEGISVPMLEYIATLVISTFNN